MARRPTSRARRIDPLITFNALSIEGAILQPEMIARIAAREAGEQKEVAYGLDPKEKLRDVIQTKFPLAQSLLARLAGSDRGPQALQRFLQNFFAQVFEFTDLERIRPVETTGRSFPIGHQAFGGRVPIVFAPHGKIDASSKAFSDGGRARSPSQMLQEYLNVEDRALWGLVCDGIRLRLYRDNAALTRPAYLEADLERILDADTPLMADFSVLWMVIHASRFGSADTPVTDCVLERWRDAGRKQGTIARERLRDGVEKALLEFGQGFLEHPANYALRADLHEGRLSPQSFLEALLRLIYRFLFVFTAEDRDLLHLPSPEEPDAARAHARAKAIYARGYSLARLRERSVRRHARDRHGDGWEGVTILFRALWRGEAVLALPALGGLFTNVGGPRSFEDCSLSNARLYEAIFRLAWLRTEAGLERVNWRDMETEELGSVYESLLELTPKLGGPEGFSFIGATGNARKTTASYYTPDRLVQALLDEALDPLIEETVKEKDGKEAIEALLGLKIIDPACGSGHFLLAAARRVAARCAQLASPGAPSASDYRHWLREAARRCLFGVDKNPLAVELAKVALWIETVEPGKPLSFLDAHIRCGDSLLGVYDLDALQKGIPDGAYKPLTGDVKAATSEWRKRNKAEREARAQGELGLIGPPRVLMEAARRLEAQEEDDLSAVEAKAKAFQAFLAGEDRHRLETACDIYIAAFLLPKTNPPARLSGDGGAYVPTTRDVWEMLAGQQPHGLLIGNAVDAAKGAGAFHWPLEFPQVFASGGFDLALGNPPWEVNQLSEEEYFSSRASDIAELSGKARKDAIKNLETTDPRLWKSYRADKRTNEAANEFIRGSSRFPLTAVGKINTYALFAELFSVVAHRAGIIVPTGIATDATTAPFFASLVDNERLAALLDFENRERLFTDVYFRVRFCLLVMAERENEMRFSCLLTQPVQIADEDRHFILSPQEIFSINPNTRTAPMFRSRADADLSTRIYNRVPVLIDETRGAKAHQSGNQWAIEFRQGLFNMTSDSGLFRTARQLAAAGFARDGRDWVADNSDCYVPLIEAKMIHFYNHRHGDFSDATERDGADIRELPRADFKTLSNAEYEPSPRYWVPDTEIDSRLLQKGWRRNWLAGWRDITNVSNERTVIPTTIPRSGVGHTVPLIFLDARPEQWAVLCSILSSLSLDYFARQKVGGTHLTYGYLKQFPVPAPSDITEANFAFIVPRVLELTYTSHSMRPFAEDLGFEGKPFSWDPDRRAQLCAELDAYVARLYGLMRNQLRFILDPAEVYGSEYPSETFRVLKEREIKAYGEYRTARLVLDAWDRLERGEVPEISPPITIETRPAAVAQQAVSIDPATLPDGAWARPAAGTQDVRAATLVQLAALMKALPGPTPIEQVRRAALYALEPRYLTRWLSGADRTTWLRLVGPDAVLASGASIAAFAPTIDAGWRDTVTQLRGMGAIIEDAAAQTWAPGARLDDFYTETWPDGRAAFVLKALESLTPEEMEADLSVEDQQWARADAG